MTKVDLIPSENRVYKHVSNSYQLYVGHIQYLVEVKMVLSLYKLVLAFKKGENARM